ncbi:MAG: hypothetical protein AAGJ97_12580, partial [Planctomycetota bacterium]
KAIVLTADETLFRCSAILFGIMLRRSLGLVIRDHLSSIDGVTVPKSLSYGVGRFFEGEPRCYIWSESLGDDYVRRLGPAVGVEVWFLGTDPLRFRCRRYSVSVPLEMRSALEAGCDYSGNTSLSVECSPAFLDPPLAKQGLKGRKTLAVIGRPKLHAGVHCLRLDGSENRLVFADLDMTEVCHDQRDLLVECQL